MSISSIGSLSGSSALQQMEALFEKLEAKSTSSSDTTTTTSSTAASDSDSISGFSQLLSNLEDLATTDPSKFKQETADIATQLNKAASNTTGDESSFLSALANQFQEAADTGDPSALAPKPHGHRPPGATSSSTDASSQTNAYGSSDLFSMLSSSSSTTGSDTSTNSQDLLTSLFGNAAS